MATGAPVDIVLFSGGGGDPYKEGIKWMDVVEKIPELL